VEGLSEVQKLVEKKRTEIDKQKKKLDSSGEEGSSNNINTSNTNTGNAGNKMEQEVSKQHNFSPVTSEDDMDMDEKDDKKDKEMDEMVLSYMKNFPDI